MKEFFYCDNINRFITEHKNEIPSEDLLLSGKININIYRPIKRFRIYCTKPKSLHLRGVYLYKSGDIIPLEKSMFTISHGKLFQADSFEFVFNTIVSPFMFHTENDIENNYIDIRFNNELAVDSMSIYTRNSDRLSALRANTIAIKFYDVNNNIVLNYEYEKLIVQAAHRIYNNLIGNVLSKPYSYEISIGIILVILYARNGLFTEVSKNIKQLEIKGVKTSYIKKYINEFIISKTEFKYTLNYGVSKKTFSSFNDDEKYSYLSSSLNVVKILQKSFPCTYFAFGTLLGFIREKDYFIPHDYDIDITVVGQTSSFSNIDLMKECLIELLKNNNVIVEGVFDHMCLLHVKYMNECGAESHAVLRSCIDSTGRIANT